MRCVAERSIAELRSAAREFLHTTGRLRGRKGFPGLGSEFERVNFQVPAEA